MRSARGSEAARLPIVSVAQALEDAVYRLRGTSSVGAPANSWFNHWEITRRPAAGSYPAAAGVDISILEQDASDLLSI